MLLRPATDGDRDAVLALGVAEETAWFGEPEVNADEVGEWVDDEGGMTAGVVAVDDGGRVRGFASAGRHEAVYLADPARTDALADALLPWLREQAGTLELMTFAGDRARLRAFERHGLRHRRSAFSLARPDSTGPLPAAAFPDGVEVEPYRLGDADEAVHRLIYVDAAWASVPGHVEREIEALRETVRRCRSVFLARRDGRPVGWVAGRLMASGRGYVDTLAVATSERRRGLARALLLHAFADLQQAGAGDLALGVQAENETALGLYRSVGLEVEREWRLYRGPVEAAMSRTGQDGPRAMSDPTQTTTTVSDIGVAMFSVADQDAALAFYTQKLGFEVRADVRFGEDEQARWLEVAPPGSRARLALNPPMGGEPGGAAIGVETADVLGEHARLKAIGGVDVDPEPMRMPNAPLMFGLRDPDGNHVWVVEAQQTH